MTTQKVGSTDNTGPQAPTGTPARARTTRSWAFWACISAVVLVVGYFLGLGILYLVHQQVPFKAGEGYSAFTAIFVLTLAIERLLDPFTSYFGNDVDAAKTDVAQKRAVVATQSAPAAHKEQAAAALPAATETLDLARQTTALVTWGVASLLGFVLAAGLNVLLLSSVAASGQPPRWLDLLVTGLVLGAGTKPVHDLVSRIETAKDQATDDKAAADAKSSTT